MRASSQARESAPKSGARARPARVVLSAAVGAVGLARMARGDFAGFRRGPSPMPGGWKPIPPTMLKASDEQTVAAVAAVLDAVAGLGPAAPSGGYPDWGIVAAPRFPGRAMVAVALDRFEAEGVWGVSPHLIPHFALHSEAGTLSLALGVHGPNLGVGGGADSALQGALTALTWLAEGRLPGVWLVLSGYTPEHAPPPKGSPPPEPGAGPECQALALAVVPEGSAGGRGPRLRIVAEDGPAPEGPVDLRQVAGRLRPGAGVGAVVPTAIYRPHIRFPQEDAATAWTIGADPTSGLRAELVGDAPVAAGAGADEGGRR